MGLQPLVLCPAGVAESTCRGRVEGRSTLLWGTWDEPSAFLGRGIRGTEEGAIPEKAGCASQQRKQNFTLKPGIPGSRVLTCCAKSAERHSLMTAASTEYQTVWACRWDWLVRTRAGGTVAAAARTGPCGSYIGTHTSTSIPDSHFSLSSWALMCTGFSLAPILLWSSLLGHLHQRFLPGLS